MKNRDGLSRKERWERITSVRPFRIYDHKKEAIFRQIMKIAGSIRFYNLSGEQEGYWDELLSELGKMKDPHWIPDGDMEPSQGLLYAFLQSYQEITKRFNDRWKEYAWWYLHEIIQVESVPSSPEYVWFSFLKSVPTPVIVEKDTVFTFREASGGELVFRLPEGLEINNVKLIHVATLCFERDPSILPAGWLNHITSVQYRDLTKNRTPQERLFGKEQRALKAQGIEVSSPSLLLKQGQRTVCLEFESVSDEWIEMLEEDIRRLQDHLKGWSRERVVYKLLSDLFYIRISAAYGWEEVPEYAVKWKEECLTVQFTLAEDFPEIGPCLPDLHEKETSFPVVGLYPNVNAWIYPWSWLSRFSIIRIRIRTLVEGMRDLQIYNELGRVDNSQSFAPFGNNTEQGGWFAVGSYEMAVKNTCSVDIHIEWGQLPAEEKGLGEYYEGYGKEIHNDTFKVCSRYLTDYSWRPTPGEAVYSLFSTSAPELPDGKLSGKIHWTGIRTERMAPFRLSEEEYEYSITSRTGYISFVLTDPDMGLGEKYYRYLFAEQMMKNARTKKISRFCNLPYLLS
ncbi:MAG: hypothetical protein LUG51_09165 [Tannerellaceae bacterium]|nr:hypothetical protein [Tannerellaceae bacterium]